MSLTNRYQPQFQGFGEVEIRPNDTFKSLFGEPRNGEEFKQITRDPKYKKLHDKYSAVFQAGAAEGLHTGETQVLIYQYSNGMSLHEIEYRKLDDIIIFIQVNAKNLLSIINPEFHAFLLRTGYFDKNPQEPVKPHRLSRISRVIKSLMGKQDSARKLMKFSEIISRM